MKIKLDGNTCIKCKICKQYCAFNAITFDDGYPLFNDNCVYCGACESRCPVDAIHIERKVVKEDLSAYSGVFSFVEFSDGEIKPVSFEMASTAKRLAMELGEKCSAIVVGREADRIASQLSRYGVDEIIAVENPQLRVYNTEQYTDVMVGILSKLKPSICLFGATHLGRDLAPRVAARMNTGLTADCTALKLNEEKMLLQVRPTFGGNIIASIITPYHRPQLATVRTNVMKKEITGGKNASIQRLRYVPGKNDIKIRLVREVKEISPYSDVEQADIIVAGGKGMGNAENFKYLFDVVESLSNSIEKMQVALGASRSAVDVGWVPHQHQVGQTGKTVNPKLYIACGISGQLQHIMGMREAKKIIVINRDQNAPIFRMADLGIVGDVNEVLPQLLERLKKEINETGVALSG